MVIQWHNKYEISLFVFESKDKNSRNAAVTGFSLKTILGWPGLISKTFLFFFEYNLMPIPIYKCCQKIIWRYNVESHSSNTVLSVCLIFRTHHILCGACREPPRSTGAWWLRSAYVEGFANCLANHFGANPIKGCIVTHRKLNPNVVVSFHETVRYILMFAAITWHW